MPSSITITAALALAQAKLAGTSDSAQLDAEILLAECMKVARSYLIAWPLRTVAAEQYQLFMQNIERRARGEPLAYITGSREFWSLNLFVTPDTLIPRPETELLVEILLQTLPEGRALTIADMGTGSGAIALALASARPHWQIHATDLMPATLAVAKANARRLQITNINFHLGYWYDALPAVKFDAIVSNPPYIALGDTELSTEVVKYEPHTALIAGADGLQDIKYLIEQASGHLLVEGWLLLEHGARQGQLVANLLEKAGYNKVATLQDLAGLDRVTIGRLVG